MSYQPDRAKRDATRLMASMGEPAMGRRETPESEDAGAVRRRVAVGVALGAAVVVAVLALLVFLGAGVELAG